MDTSHEHSKSFPFPLRLTGRRIIHASQRRQVLLECILDFSNLFQLRKIDLDPVESSKALSGFDHILDLPTVEVVFREFFQLGLVDIDATRYAAT